MEQPVKEEHAEESRKLLRGAGVFAALTAASRGLGLFRDVAVTAVLSAAARDAFIFAFSLPMMFRNLFGEGALTNSFVPAYVERLEKSDAAGADRLASLVGTALAALLFALAAVGGALCLGAGFLPGLSKENSLVLKLLGMMAPFMPLVCLYAFFLAILTSHRRFAVPAGAPLLLNAAILAGAFVAWKRFPLGSDAGVYVLAAAVLVGGVIQLAVELPAARRAGVRVRPALDFKDPAFRGVVAAMAPVLVGTGAFQINTFLNRLFALELVPESGAQSYLALANLLVMAPLGIVAVALSTAALPVLSSLHARGDGKGFNAAFGGAARMSVFLLLPVSMVLVVAGEPVVRMLYERGGWAAEETPRMVRVLFWSALALVPTVVSMLSARAFYAMKRPKIPARIAVITVAVNIALSLLLVRALFTATEAAPGGIFESWLKDTRLAEWLGGPLPANLLDEAARVQALHKQAAAAARWFSGAAGLALATAVAGLVQMALLLGALRRERREVELGPVALAALRAAALSVLTGVCVYWVVNSLPPAGEGFIIVAQRGIAPPVAAVFVYSLLASLLDVREYREFWKALRGDKKKKDKKQDADDEEDDEDDEEADDGGAKK